MNTPAAFRVTVNCLLDAVLLLIEIGEGALDFYIVRFVLRGEADSNICEMEISAFRPARPVVGKNFIRQRLQLQCGNAGNTRGERDMIRVRLRSHTARMNGVILAKLKRDLRLAL